MSTPGSVTIVPSVHFSPVHRKRVRDTIREEEPDVVAVELDEYRFERLEREAGADPFDLARELPPPAAMTYTTLRTIQRTVVRLFGLDPETTDMEAAIETAAERDLEVALIDEPIRDTVAALSDRVGLDTLPKLVLRAQQLSPADQARATELMAVPMTEIEDGDDVQPAIEQMRTLLPEVAEVMIDRRDRTMARNLHALRQDGHDVVAVVGAGHHNGLVNHLADLEGETVSDVTVPIRPPTRNVTRIPIE
ncbi:TraB domain-containing protein [Halopiger goleimassiliensis]|uniref:TraB domain-containing protein n=1 Tax=Halopiger goleimassiliensis TaxID=1293048 RepID=UPI00067791CC|nr:TraB/GumN family protein [Halopiger goleimassiliensis]